MRQIIPFSNEDFLPAGSGGYWSRASRGKCSFLLHSDTRRPQKDETGVVYYPDRVLTEKKAVWTLITDNYPKWALCEEHAEARFPEETAQARIDRDAAAARKSAATASRRKDKEAVAYATQARYDETGDRPADMHAARPRRRVSRVRDEQKAS